MNKIIDYPRMAAFVGAALSANSGGFVGPLDEIRGTPEEWQAAEDWWVEFHSPMEQVIQLGHKADEGYTVCEPTPDGEFTPCAPWQLLERFY